jgi:hypothetical protein
MSMEARGELAAASIQISSYGVVARIECNSSVPLQRLRSVLPPHSVEVEHTFNAPKFILRSSGHRGSLRYEIVAPERRIKAQCMDEALCELRKEVHLHVGEHAPNHVFVHAGVAALNGLTIICPGRSYSGKSTLIKSLLDAGATYFSDEYAVFDEQGHVHSFPFPMSLRYPVTARYQVRSETTGTGPVRPDIVLFARFQPNRRWRPRELSPSDALLQLTRHSLAMRSRPGTVLSVLSRVAKMSRTYTGIRGDTASVLEWLGTIDTAHD